jgi:hypothetical protein
MKQNSNFWSPQLHNKQKQLQTSKPGVVDTPVVPATWENKARESIEPRSSRPAGENIATQQDPPKKREGKGMGRRKGS